MRRATCLALALFLAPCAAHAKKSPPPAPTAPPPDGVHVESVAGATRLDAVLPGWLRGYALPRLAGGRRDVVLLVGAVSPAAVAKREPAAPAGAPCDGPEPADAARTAPCKLLRLDTAGSGAVEVLRDDLPADSRSLDALDLDGDGTDEVLLFLDGGIRALRDDGAKRLAKGPEPLVSDAALGYGPRSPRIVRSPGAAAAYLPLATADGLRVYGRLPDGRFGLLSETLLPISAWLEYGSLRIRTPEVTELGSVRDGAPTLAAPADGAGEVRSDRLRSVLLDPLASRERRSVECWSRLPERERIADRAYLQLDGRPAMLVTTTSADKLKIFGEKRLRLFLLEGDRTKAGKPPLLAAETGANLWQQVEPSLLDVDGDSRTDLVIAFWKGLKNDAVQLEAYLRKEDGSFDPSSRGTTIDADDADRSFVEYGRDLDGDGTPDLLVIAGGKVLVFPGARKAAEGKGLVASEPRYALPLPAWASAGGTVVASVGSGGVSSWAEPGRAGIPRPVDLDGDGRPELLLDAGLPDGRSAFVIYRLAGEP